MQEMVTVQLENSDVVGGTTRIVDLIADLQEKLQQIPEEFRSDATLEICAYDWDGSYIQYDRPITSEEVAQRAAKIDAQRQRAAKAAEDHQVDLWLRNIRRYAGIPDRDDAMEFLRTDAEANNYHPDVFRTGNHGHA